LNRVDKVPLKASMGRLEDNFGRRIEQVRLSVTDRCNLRCVYCTPQEGMKSLSHHEVLRYEEIIRLAKIFVKLGISKLRITGGEPLVRKDVVKLVEKLRRIPGIRSLPMTTNGTLLAQFAEPLSKAGVTQLNISLDTLNREKYRGMTRADKLAEAIQGIQAARAAGIPVKLNVVPVRGWNDDEVLNFVELAHAERLTVRFIEFMPFSNNQWEPGKFIPTEELKAAIARRYTLVPEGREYHSAPAEYFRVEGGQGKIGFITSVTGSFCASCNRLRVTADGRIKPCLHSGAELDLRGPLRDGALDEELIELMGQAVSHKPEEHPNFLDAREKLKLPGDEMCRIGG